MHPTIASDVAKHRIADWHRQAGRDRTARAARTNHASHRLSVTLAGLAAAALALPAGQGAATAASHRPHHHAAQATVQQTRNGLTVTDLNDLANVKRDLQAAAQQMQRGMTVAGLQDLAKAKRACFRDRRNGPRTVSITPPLPHAKASAEADAFALPPEARNGGSAHLTKANPSATTRRVFGDLFRPGGY